MADINVQAEIQSILKEGFLDKQSRFLKTWRRYSIALLKPVVCTDPTCSHDLQGSQSVQLTN